MDDLDRMLRRLVQALRTGFPEYVTRPFEVGELYQRIIPYRHNRRELGLDTNGDYELVLTRLLSGERGYLVGDQQLQDAMRQELASSNPDTSAFRAFADARVRITEEALRQADIPGIGTDDVRLSRASVAPTPAPAAPASPAAPPAPTASFRPSAVPATPPTPDLPSPPPVLPASPQPAVRAAAPSAAAFTAPQRAPAPPLPFPEPASSRMPSSTRSVSPSALGGSCRYCGGTLPEGRRYTFCPHCGQNLTVQHCPACNTELEIGWKFCTTCGRAVGGA